MVLKQETVGDTRRAEAYLKGLLHHYGADEDKFLHAGVLPKAQWKEPAWHI